MNYDFIVFGHPDHDVMKYLLSSLWLRVFLSYMLWGHPHLTWSHLWFEIRRSTTIPVFFSCYLLPPTRLDPIPDQYFSNKTQVQEGIRTSTFHPMKRENEGVGIFPWISHFP